MRVILNSMTTGSWEINDDFFDCLRAYYDRKSEVKMYDMFEIESDVEQIK